MSRITITLAALCAFVSPVWAIDFTQPIIDQNGKVAHERVIKETGAYDETSPILTIGSVVSTALFMQPQQDPRAGQSDPLAQAKRAMLALKIHDAKDLDLTSEQVTLIKQAVAPFPPLTVLRVIEAIDPASLK